MPVFRNSTKRANAACRAAGFIASGILVALSPAHSRGSETSALSEAFSFDSRYEASGIAPAFREPEVGIGISDAFELSMLWLREDTDGDGMPDVWEREHGLDPERDDAAEDLDGDGLTNLEEFLAGTDPEVADAVAEPREDPWAKYTGISGAFVTDTRIIVTGESPDPSLDFAVVRISSVFVCDTLSEIDSDDYDGDGIPDWWEEQYSGSKTGFVASEDTDGDGRTALEEYISGTDPTDPESFFKVSIEMDAPAASAEGASGYSISWEAVQGRVYQLYSKTALSDAWPEEPERVVDGADGPVSIHFEQGSPTRFFQVRVALAPEP